MIIIARLCRYPVKGLSAEDLSRVTLRSGCGMPGDRRFAIAHGSTRFEGEQPEWKPKDQFLILMRNSRLAKLQTSFDEQSGTLTIHRDGKQVACGNIAEPLGRHLIEQFLAAYLSDEARGAPKIVSAAGISFTDTRENYVSIINLSSVTDIERVVRTTVDPVRFRGNLYLAGAAPWQETDWPRLTLSVGGAKVEVVDSIGRCAATNVNPATGERDLNIPKSLMEGFRHVECGVYGKVTDGGDVEVGSPVEVL